MRRFAALYARLDGSNRTSEKLEALRDYFVSAPPEDAIWAVYILSGRKIGRTINSRQLRQWAAEVSGFPEWMLQECHNLVGDLSETLSLLIPFASPIDIAPPLHEMIESRLLPAGKLLADKQREIIVQTWRELSAEERFVFHKLTSGNFRVGVSRQSLILALAAAAQVEPSVIANRLSGNWSPEPAMMRRLLTPAGPEEPRSSSLPYPFMLAHALHEPPDTLGALEEWNIEWKWDGIRSQLIRREGKVAIWSRGDELISGAFPELIQAAALLPDGMVLDGEIVAWDEAAGHPQPFAALQRRLNRKNVELSFWPDVPVKLIAFDLLELDSRDLRADTFAVRRQLLDNLIRTHSSVPEIGISANLHVKSWDELLLRMEESRARRVEGVMLKHRDSPYRAGRPTGLWWKLKVQPYTVDAVLIAAQSGSGKRAGLFTDYTFGVWNDAHTELLPVAKAYSGLTDQEIVEMDRFVRRHTTGRYGPVHAVEPVRVLELGFEAIQRSTRHKSGVALRFPRILRLRVDKKPDEADTLQSLRQLLAGSEGAI